MLSELLLASAFQIGPFYAQCDKDDYQSAGPFYSHQAETTDVLWPLFTRHRDWWRCCWFIHDQWDLESDAYQFDVLPLWFNGRTREGESYAGLFPIYGHHPHFLLMYDWDFALWPLWMRYKMPRPSTGEWMTSNVILFPFIHWRSDGSWGVWPLAGTGHQRESDHHYALWPIITWASYREDRDTAGAGSSWMFWPLYGQIRRAREEQDLFIPPLFSYARTPTTTRLRCPWPFFEWERSTKRTRLNIFPLYETIHNFNYSDHTENAAITRYLWRFVELYRDENSALEEIRVFPFYLQNRTYLRVWPFYESHTPSTTPDVTYRRVLSLFPIRWVEAVDRNWSAFWTFYESVSNPVLTTHSLFWGLIKWQTIND